MWPSWAKGRAQQLIQLLDRNLEPPLRRVWWSHGNQNYGFGIVLEFGIVFWLVVWNMNFIFPYTGNNHPNWLSYFSEGLKPPTCIVWEGFSIQYISSTVSCGCGCGQFFTWLESWLDFGQFLSSWQRLCIISGARNRGLRGPGSWPVWLMFLPATKLQTVEPRHPKLEEFLETLETLMRLLGQAWPKYIWIIELDDGKIYRKALYLMVKTMVSCRFSLKPIQWLKEHVEICGRNVVFFLIFFKAPKGRHIQTCIPTAYVIRLGVFSQRSNKTVSLSWVDFLGGGFMVWFCFDHFQPPKGIPPTSIFVGHNQPFGKDSFPRHPSTMMIGIIIHHYTSSWGVKPPTSFSWHEWPNDLFFSFERGPPLGRCHNLIGAIGKW